MLTYISASVCFSSRLAKWVLCLVLCLPFWLNAGNEYQATADLNVRSGPSSSDRSIAIIKNGDKLIVLDSTNSYWFKVAYKGDTGYVARKYLLHLADIVPPPATKSETKHLQQSKGPSMTSIIFGAISIGCILLIIISLASKRKKAAQGGVKHSSRTAAVQHTTKQMGESPTKPTTTPIQRKSKVTVEVVHENPVQTHAQIDNSQQHSKSPPKTPSSSAQITKKTSAVNNQTPHTSPQNKLSNSDSIIDVSDHALRLSKTVLQDGLQKYVKGVPSWSHRYIYSAGELNQATSDQRNFYTAFKQAFLSGTYYDVEGNTNYPFILLFDLAEDSKQNNRIELLIQQYELLGKHYPRTSTYAPDILIRRCEEIGDFDQALQLRSKYNRYSGYTFNADYWGLGTRTKAKYNLSNEQVKILNKLIDTSNNFNTIEYVQKHLILSFFSALDGLEKHFVSCGTSMIDEVNKIADTELLKHFKLKKGSKNHKEQLSRFETTIHQSIYKIGENTFREHFFIGRKTDLAWYIHSPAALQQFHSVFGEPLDRILKDYLSKLEEPDDATEAEFNAYGKARWKSKLERIKTTLIDSQSHLFYDSVVKLGNQNSKNPAVENIFFEGAKYIAKLDKLTALKLYVHYVDRDLHSVSFDNKQLTKTIHKTLFQNPEQATEFENIIAGLVKDKNLENALSLVPGVYQAKRKKITLDRNKIKEVQEQHSDTVELLNEYLKDESELVPAAQPKEQKETLISNQLSSVFQKVLGLNDLQVSALILISKNGYTISVLDFETFAKSIGAFRNSLIESINETCYETLDDVLIEEADGSYSINESYYEQILEK